MLLQWFLQWKVRYSGKYGENIGYGKKKHRQVLNIVLFEIDVLNKRHSEM